MPKRTKRGLSRKQRERISYWDKWQYVMDLEDNQHAVTDADIAKLRVLSKDTDTTIRSDVAALLVCFDRIEAKEMLMRLAKDEDMLVRTEANDSLCVFPYVDVYMYLKGRMTAERHYLPRCYAIMSWATISTAMGYDAGMQIAAVNRLLSQESNAHCRLSYYEALYHFGQKEALNDVLAFLQHSDYLIQGATISTLERMNKADYAKMIPHVEEYLRKEIARGSRIDTEKFLQTLRESR